VAQSLVDSQGHALGGPRVTSLCKQKESYSKKRLKTC
jgi:hypothetical protein